MKQTHTGKKHSQMYNSSILPENEKNYEIHMNIE